MDSYPRLAGGCSSVPTEIIGEIPVDVRHLSRAIRDQTTASTFAGCSVNVIKSSPLLECHTEALLRHNIDISYCRVLFVTIIYMGTNFYAESLCNLCSWTDIVAEIEQKKTMLIEVCFSTNIVKCPPALPSYYIIHICIHDSLSLYHRLTSY